MFVIVLGINLDAAMDCPGLQRLAHPVERFGYVIEPLSAGVVRTTVDVEIQVIGIGVDMVTIFRGQVPE